MTRLILGLLLLTVAIVAVRVLDGMIRSRPLPAPRRAAAPPSLEVPMPEGLRTVAFVLLVLLALGVTSGLIGGV